MKLKQTLNALRWYLRYEGSDILYAQSSKGAWDGDEMGKEWTVGFSIHTTTEMTGETYFNAYFDDGQGNGDGIGEFRSLDKAIEAAEQENAKL